MRARVGWVGRADAVERACAREIVVLVEFVEREGHDAVGGPEGLFNPISMVHVDVDV